jgi:hypothetical protein
MSYIRCLSNPEGLYIWRERGSRVAICENIKPIIYVRTRDFHAVIRQYLDSGHVPIKRGELRLTETGDFKKCLHTPDRNIIMYDVTWDYICENLREQ